MQTRPYRKSLRPQKRRGVPVGDESWSELFNFMEEKGFTMDDFLACVCTMFSKYPQGLYETTIEIKGHFFNVKIEEHILKGQKSLRKY